MSSPVSLPTFPPRYFPGERRRVMSFAALVMLVFTLPYLVNVARQTPNERFGGFLFGTMDGNTYLAKMRLGATGDGLFRLVYTHEPHDGSLLIAPYLLLGKVAALLASPDDPAFVDAALLVYHAARIVFGAILIVLTHRFIAVFIEDPPSRWLALALITLGGGLGWLVILFGGGTWLGSEPVDLLLPEGYTFYLLYGIPHLCIARVGLLGGMLFLFSALNAQGWRAWLPRMIAAGLCWGVMAVCVSFYLAVLVAVLGAWAVAVWLRSRRLPLGLIARCAVGGVFPALWFGYNLYVFSTNPIMRALQSQNLLPSPHPLHYVLGFGLPALAALPAFGWAWRRGARAIVFLLPPAWLVIAPFLAYAPIEVQRRLLEAVFLPLGVLAVIGLRLWFARARPRRLATVGLLTACLLTPALILASGMAAYNPALFRAGDEIAALDWLNDQAAPGALVLANPQIGIYAPVRADVRVYVGHGVETVDFRQKEQIAGQFFAGTLDAAARRALLALADYVIVGPGDALPDGPGLRLVYQAGRYRVYAVESVP